MSESCPKELNASDKQRRTIRFPQAEVGVGRPEKPVDPDAGAVQRFAWQLRQLRERAGSPGYRALARRAHYSASTLAEAAKGDRLPSLDVTRSTPDAPWAASVDWTARRVLMHVIAETAQHAGHADIIREAIDGAKTMG